MYREYWIAVVVGIAFLTACGSGGGEATNELNRFATLSEEEFQERGEGTFYDTEYAVYCRAGSGFDEGPFAAVGFQPTVEGYEFCYNVSSDRKQVGLRATSMKDGSAQCLVLDASSGEIQRSEITEDASCTP